MAARSPESPPVSARSREARAQPGEGAPSASPADVREVDLAEMATDMSRLLAVTRDESDAAEQDAHGWATAPQSAPRTVPAAASPAASPRRSAAVAAALGDDATASFVSEVLTLVDADGIEDLKRLQQRTLGNLQNSAEMLSNFNRFAAASYPQAAQSFARSTRLVQSVTADLHHIMKRTRALQARIRDAYPAAWASVGERPRFGDDD